MKYSINIISYNRKDSLEKVLAEIESLKFSSFEVNVLDQGSTDGSREMLKVRKSKVKMNIYLSEINLGVAGGRNFLSKKSKGEFLVSLDDDSWFKSSYALNTIDSRLQQDSYDIVGLKILNVHGEVRDWCYPGSQSRWSKIEHNMPFFVGCGHIIRRTFFEDLGGYNEALYFWGEELDLTLHGLAKYGELKIIYLPDVEVVHKPNPKSRLYWNGDRLYYKVRNRIYLFRYFPVSIYREVFRLIYILFFFYEGVKYRNISSVMRGLRDSNSFTPPQEVLSKTLSKQWIVSYFKLKFIS